MFINQLEAVQRRYEEIESRLIDPTLFQRPEELRKLSQERASLQELVSESRRYRQLEKDYQSSQEMVFDHDPELAALAQAELKTLELQLAESQRRLMILLLPKDPHDGKNIVFEIRAGAGGEEAALFVSELFRAYQRFAERQGWMVELLSVSPSGLGGFKEVIAEIRGEQVFSRLKWEAGVHRVQRVPATEAQGRVHTSTVTLAVLPEADEVDVVIHPTDLRIDVYRSGGAGGQGVNTTDSAVRLTHLPSGLVVVCQDERSQHKNKDKALKILRSRLYDLELSKSLKTQTDARRSMVGTGDRSERIRTYNFPQGRLTDHRINLTVYRLDEVMEGKMDEIIDALISYYQLRALEAQGANSWNSGVGVVEKS